MHVWCVRWGEVRVSMAFRIGVDSGGTFTDVCLLDEDNGRVSVWKLPSTPTDPSIAIAGGTRQILERRQSTEPAEVSFFGHGTTVSTNALIQGRGARTGLVTNEGFRDLLELARQRRPHLYDLQTDKPEPLVPRDRRHEVAARMHYDGRVERAPDAGEIKAVARALKDQGVEAVAICLLYGFLDPSHEIAIAEGIAEVLGPEVFVSCAHRVCPEFREYERLSTTVVNGFLGPIMRGYLDNLTPRLREAGVAVDPHITQSNGGTISFETASAQPVRTILSGPSTGVVGALETARMVGERDLITFDMGGTSTDVALIEGGEPGLTTEAEVHGYPIKVPMIDIQTVGAGGGSIAHIDSGGFLKVGPRSAGAEPGPVCYGLGNEEPTVTDANVVMGVLDPNRLLGGRMEIDHDRALAAMERLGGKIGLGALETAAGIVRVVTANMARAIRLISVQRGHDPRDYCLIPFGGGGPAHAGRLARELGMGRILVPRNPGILCALGLLLTDLSQDFSVTRRTGLNADGIGAARAAIVQLRAEAEAWFTLEDVAPERRAIGVTADMRYAGQNHELNVSVPEITDDAGFLDQLAANFAELHDRRYGYVAPEEPVELITFRLKASGLVDKPGFESAEEEGPDASPALVSRRPVYSSEDASFTETPIYDRDLLRPGNQVTGPAVITQFDSTTLVLAGQTATVDRYFNLALREGDVR
jgi:N-methylhydantoinase A